MTAWKTISESIQMMRHFSKTFWTIMIFYFVFTFIGNLVFENENQRFAESITFIDDANPFPGGLGRFYLVLFIWLVVSLYIGSVFGVAWQRRVLIDEPLRVSPAMFFRPEVWSYFGGSILIFLIFIGIVVALSIIAGILGGIVSLAFASSVLSALIVITLLLVPPIVWLLIFIMRLALTLPARALGEKVTFGNALSVTKGQFWLFFRILFFLVLVTVLLSIPVYLSTYVGSEPDAISTTPIWATIWSSAVSAFSALMQAGVFALLYIHFLRQNPQSVFE